MVKRVEAEQRRGLSWEVSTYYSLSFAFPFIRRAVQYVLFDSGTATNYGFYIPAGEINCLTVTDGKHPISMSDMIRYRRGLNPMPFTRNDVDNLRLIITDKYMRRCLT